MAEPRSRSVTLNPGMTGSGDDVVQALKVPPHSVEAEQSLLGGLLIDNAAWEIGRASCRERVLRLV